MKKNNSGTLNGAFRYECEPEKGAFVKMSRLKKDDRIIETDWDDFAYGHIKTYDIPGCVLPIEDDDNTKLCGRPKGVQGHQNSCYIDATLFSMFNFCTTFDSFIAAGKQKLKSKEDDSVEEAKCVLREGIVNPLRK